MNKQFEFPFKKEDEKKFINKTFGGKAPSPEILKEYDEGMIEQEDILTSPESNKETGEKALIEIRRRIKEIEDKEKNEN